MLLNFTHERGKKLCREANKAESPELLAAGWYRGLSEHLEAVARHIEALSLVSPSERRKLAVGAEEWAAWVADKLARLAPRLANIREGTGFEVVSGGLPTDAPEVPANPVAVRLMVVKP